MMRKKLMEIVNCNECYYFEEYENGSARCTEMQKRIRTVVIPKWCPLRDADAPVENET